tara:strand:- start:7897 stop:8046 length:150 start_codon:yes stop_codon:yes gene_type:complete
MARGSDLGDRGELTEGMLRSAVRGMFWWDELELEMSREIEDGEVGVGLI